MIILGGEMIVSLFFELITLLASTCFKTQILEQTTNHMHNSLCLLHSFLSSTLQIFQQYTSVNRMPAGSVSIP